MNIEWLDYHKTTLTDDSQLLKELKCFYKVHTEEDTGKHEIQKKKKIRSLYVGLEFVSQKMLC